MHYRTEGEDMENNTQPKKNNYLLDVIVISATLAVSLMFLLILFLTKKEGAFIEVDVNGENIGEYLLSENATYSLNGGSNILVIENGEAYLSFSDCPDHTCEKTGKIKHVGQSIICLPNKVIITVKGPDENGVDIVS